MSYMKQVANMLGVEIGEKFNIKQRKGEFYFTDKGLRDTGTEFVTHWILLRLLYGDYEIVKIPESAKEAKA